MMLPHSFRGSADMHLKVGILLFVSLVLVACAGRGGLAPRADQDLASAHRRTGSGPIRHVIFIIQESRGEFNGSVQQRRN